MREVWEARSRETCEINIASDTLNKTFCKDSNMQIQSHQRKLIDLLLQHWALVFHSDVVVLLFYLMDKFTYILDSGHLTAIAEIQQNKKSLDLQERSHKNSRQHKNQCKFCIKATVDVKITCGLTLTSGPHFPFVHPFYFLLGFGLFKAEK